MKVIKPVPMTDAQLVSSTAPETDQPAYSAATNYALDALVMYGHVIYICVQSPNLAHTPDISPLYWLAQSPTNRWAMFDNEVTTQTALASPLTVVIKPGYVNSLALFGLEGTTLAVTVRDGLAGPIFYAATISLDGTIIADWYQYFFEPSVQLGEVVLDDLPPYGNAHITVSITGGGVVKCGHLAAGNVYFLGDAQLGAAAGIIDFSRKETDTNGTTRLNKRGFSKRATLSALIPNAQLNKVYRVLADLRATPCAWLGVDGSGYEPLTIFGIYRDFSIDVAYPTKSYCNLEIEGLT